jgi:hypothetical protein
MKTKINLLPGEELRVLVEAKWILNVGDTVVLK